MRSIMRKAVTAALAGTVLIAGVTLAAQAAAQPRQGSNAAAQQDETLDLVIFRDGKVAEGKILEETDTTVRMRVVVAGISAETTYDKSRILQIQRGAKAANNAPAKAPASAKTSEPDRSTSESATGKVAVYFAKLGGEFGRDISETPLKEIVRDARKYQPDFLIIELDNEFKIYGQEQQEATTHVFDQLWRAEELAPILTTEIRDDPQWVKKPQLVFWVKRALGGAAFLPFITPHIYFHPEGKMGGIGHLEKIFNGSGDRVVQEKQFSLRLGHAEGLAIMGGHEPKLIRAMCRTEYVLSVGFEGGKPVYYERMPNGPDEILLTDDGEGENKDTDPFVGNDVLTLTAPIAQRIGFSKGTVATREDLLFELGVARDAKVVEGRGDEILKKWSRLIEDTELSIRRLARSLQDHPIGGDFNERTRARGYHIRTLREIRGLCERYKEALNPYNVWNPPMRIEDLITNLNLTIHQLEEDQRRDRR
jgi:hypothetical protein